MDPEAGRELAAGHVPGRVGPQLVRYLRERCLLTFSGPADVRELKRAIVREGVGEIGQIIAGLIGNANRHIILDAAAAGTPTAVDDILMAHQVETWRGLVDLMLMAEGRSALLEATDGVRPELSTLRMAMNTEAVEAVDGQWRRAWAKGTSREKVWQEVYDPLAVRTHRVVISDGYFALDFDRGIGRKSEGGAQWFLRKLAESGVASVKVASSLRAVREKNVSVPELKDRITQEVARFGKPMKIDIRMVEGEFLHGRRIAFDSWAGFELHNGLRTFEGTNLSEMVSTHGSLQLGEAVIQEYNELCKPRS